MPTPIPPSLFDSQRGFNVSSPWPRRQTETLDLRMNGVTWIVHTEWHPWSDHFLLVFDRRQTKLWDLLEERCCSVSKSTGESYRPPLLYRSLFCFVFWSMSVKKPHFYNLSDYSRMSPGGSPPYVNDMILSLDSRSSSRSGSDTGLDRH